MNTHLKYRPDIDGLRAVAVLAVLFFHTNIPGFSGGFVGVDIFFVISGFLITSIIIREIQQGTFSIARFYERRIRRIFPALFPVMAFSVAAGFYLMDAKALNDFGKSIASTTLFSSNILFCHQSGYFDAPALEKPLLHTWSLAVEEQFYILFPLALAFIRQRAKERYLLWISLALSISLAASIWAVFAKPTQAFYLMQFRAWELLTGSLLALGVIPKPESARLQNALSALGLALVVYCIGFYSEKTLFPGQNAILPVLGAAMIIHGNGNDNKGNGVIGKLLSIRPLVAVGLISYSLYLWHWPIVAFTRYLMFRPMNGADSLGIIISSLAIATLSWKYLEQPFRGTHPLVPERTRLFILAGALMVMATFTGRYIDRQNGMPWRMDLYSPGLATTLMNAQESYWKRFTEWDSHTKINDATDLPIIGKGTDPTFLVWGDSHAEVLVPAIEEQIKGENRSGLAIANHSINALLGLDRNTVFDNQGVLPFLKSHPDIQTIILIGHWSGYPAKELEIGLSKAVRSIIGMGRDIVLVSDVPELSYPAPRFHMVQQRFPRLVKGIEITPTINEYNERNSNALTVLDDLASLPKVTILHPETKFFMGGRSIYTANGKLLYHDDDHLSPAGAHFVAPLFSGVLKQQFASNTSTGAKP